MNEPPPRLLLLALDAVPPALLKECCEDGSLPNLRRLREEGRSGIVSSEAELFPGSVWPTFFTMSDVSFHATYHLLQWDQETNRLRPPGDDWCEVTPFWRRLAGAGIPVITLDVPFSDTKTRLAYSTEVIGWGMHEGVWSNSHPAGLLKELNKRHGASAQVREGPGPRPDEEVARELPGIVQDVGRRAAIIEDLATRFHWRVMLAVVSETHRTGHWFWSERGTSVPQGGVRQVLKAIDEALPRLRRLLRPQDHLALFSLHGMAATTDIDRFGEVAINIDSPPSPNVARRIDPVYLLRQMLPMSLVRFIARKLPQTLYNWSFYHLQNTRRDSSKLKTVINPLDHLVYATANLKWIGFDQKEAHLAWLRSQFEGMTTADGRRLVESIVQPSALYSGPRTSLLPDLIVKPFEQPIGPQVIMADGTALTASRHSSRDGEHVSDGFYIQVGPGITPGEHGPTKPGEQLAGFLCQPAGLDLAAFS